MIKKKLYQNLLAVFMLLANFSLSAVHIWEPMAILDSYQGNKPLLSGDEAAAIQQKFVKKQGLRF